MSSLFSNFAQGTLSAQANAGATTLTSARFADLPAIASPDFAFIVLDPSNPSAEIVQITAHTASSTSVTVVRGQQGTTDRLHTAGSVWSMMPIDYHLAPGWTSYTPVLGGTGWAIGNGTRIGSFTIIGSTCLFWARILFGSSSTYGAGRPTVTLPVDHAVASTGIAPIFLAEGTAGGSNTWILLPRGIGTPVSAVEFYVQRVVTTYVDVASVTSAVPATWASGNGIYLRGAYETA